jgi:hypothetical protein
MKLIDKIKQAKSKKELDQLGLEIVLQYSNFPENQKAYIAKLKELKQDG